MTNTEEIERLGDIVGKAYCDYGKNADDVRESVANFIAKEILKHYLPSSALVRPLVWEWDEKLQWWIAKTSIGKYFIKNLDHIDGGTRDFWFFGFKGQKKWPDGNPCSSVGEAKQACQNHFNSLVGSCLQGGGEKWISVKDRLPELDSRILISEPNGKGSLVGVCDYYIDRPKRKPEFLDDRRDLCFPTHWMPLPEAPLSSLKQQ